MDDSDEAIESMKVVVDHLYSCW